MEYQKNRKRIFLSAMAVALIVLSCVLIFVDENAKDVTKTAKIENNEKAEKIHKKRKLRKNKRGDQAQASSISSASEIRIASGRKPILDLGDEEEAKLTDEYRKLLFAIRDALDNDDRETVLRLVQKIQSKRNWASEIPVSMRRAMLEALGWFGSSCVAEIAGFMADSDAEIAQSAVDKYTEALSDIDLSDRERSKLLVLASQVITDSDTMDSLLFELNNMRHSVGVDTIKQLLALGGDATQSVLQGNIEFYTGEEGLDTPAKLDEWLAQNPDDEFDEELYGGKSQND